MKKHSKQTPTIFVNIADSDDAKNPYKVVDHKGRDDRIERVTADKSFYPEIAWVFRNKTKSATFEKIKVEFRSGNPVDFGAGGSFVQNLAPGEVDDLEGTAVGSPNFYEYDLVLQDGKGQYVLDPELQIDDRGKGFVGKLVAAFAAGVVVGVVAGAVLF